MRRYLGLDVGGTKVAAGVVAEDGRVLSHVRALTAALREGGDPLAGVLGLGREACVAAGVERADGVGIALPGPADRETLRLRAAPTIPELLGVPLQPVLEAAFGCPAAGDNDANGAALAESRFGAGRGFAHVVYFTVSTGIGGGIVVDGRVFRGARGTSAEFGHLAVLPTGGPPCDCGGEGCLEALASGRGIAARARRDLGREMTPEVAAALAREGDPGALRLWDETALYLGLGVADVMNVLDPEVVVLGGGVGVGAADLLFPRLREVVRRRCMPSLAREVSILPAALGPEVGIVGAACLVLEALRR